MLGEAKVLLYTRRAASYETSFMSTVRQQFELQRSAAVTNLSLSLNKGYKTKDLVDDLLPWEDYDQAMKQALSPYVYQILVETGQDAMQQIGRQASTYDPFTPALRRYQDERANKIATDVNDETEKQLRATITEGVTAGESTYQLRARIESVFGIASTVRADRIARTEVARAQGFADVEAWTQSGVVTGKEWYTAQDERRCPWCASLDGKVYNLTENIFSKGDSLTVDGKTQHYNYDDVPHPPLHNNCRCTLLPVRVR